MDFKSLTHNELVQFIANGPGKFITREMAVREFCCRFHKYIFRVIYQACRRHDYHRGLAHVEDMAQEVYKKLFSLDCEALKNFKGKHDNSFIKYLEVIATRIVLNKIAEEKIQKRTPAGGEVSLESRIRGRDQKQEFELREIIPSYDEQNATRLQDLHKEVEFCLGKILADSRHKERDELIFRLTFYEGFKAEEISAQPGIELSGKRASNIISEIKQKLRDCLRVRGVTG